MPARDGTQDGGYWLVRHSHGVVRGGSYIRLPTLLATGNRCIHLVRVVGRETNHGRRPGSTLVGTEKFHLVYLVVDKDKEV